MRISLEPLESLGAHDDPQLGQQISQITREKGSFAGLSEQALEQSLDGQQAPSEPKSREATVESEQDPDSETSVQELRTKLVATVRAALNESALSLDFVSLLVSGQRPQVGASSMSAMLKQAVPTGTLGADTVSERSVPSAKPEAKICAAGWKLLALRNASQLLTDAASRLKEESQRDTTYWNGVKDLVDQGEVITRTKRGNASIIKFGFADCGSQSALGEGVLAKGPGNGAPVFQERSPRNNDGSDTVRVSVYEKSTSAGGGEGEDAESAGLSLVSQYRPDFPVASDLAGEIRRARSFLFEENLMSYLKLEVHQLAQHSVWWEDDQIVCDLHGHQVRIDQRPLDHEQPARGPHDNLATVIGLSLRLLLTYVYRLNLRRDHSRPQPLITDKTRPNYAEAELEPVPRLLPCVLAHIQHSLLVYRTLRLIKLMLPDTNAVVSDTSPQSSDAREPLDRLLASPSARIAFGSIEINVHSPLNDKEATYTASSATSQAKFYDLTELELWLKYISKTPK